MRFFDSLKKFRDRARLLQRLDPFFPFAMRRLGDIDQTVRWIHARQTAIEIDQILDRKLQLIQEALGRIEARQSSEQALATLQDHEFRVFSQWGEDGILQFLVRHVPIPRKIFVEFGVEDYTEANTRFLLINNNWKGLILDGSAENIARVKASPVSFWYDLTAVHAFITRENINELLSAHSITGEIGLLSIDIDGNDYWVWEAIDVIQPAIAVVEYNHRFGPDLAVTIPYDPTFDRVRAHPSRVYFGASLRALCLLAERKGYTFVGCNRNGVNAFFVRRDLKPAAVRGLSAAEGYIDGRFTELHDAEGHRLEASPEEERRIATSLPLVSVKGD